MNWAVFKNPLLWLAVAIILGICAAFIYYKPEWTPNIVTALGEILLTVFVIDHILQTAEKRKFILEQKGKLDVFVMMSSRYFFNHLEAIILMTSPVGGKKKWSIEGLEFSDLTNMYNKTTGSMVTPLLQMPFEFYFQTQQRLLDYLRKGLLEINPVQYEDLIGTLTIFTANQDRIYLYPSALERTQLTVGKARLFEEDCKILAKHKTPPEGEITGSTIHLYVYLWKEIHEVFNAHKRVKEILLKIDDDYKGYYTFPDYLTDDWSGTLMKKQMEYLEIHKTKVIEKAEGPSQPE